METVKINFCPTYAVLSTWSLARMYANVNLDTICHQVSWGLNDESGQTAG